MPAATRKSRRQKSSDADRLSRAHRAFIRLHRVEEGRTKRAVATIWPPLIKTILERMDRAGGHPAVEELFNPAELRLPFNRVMLPRWTRMAEAGVSFERQWIGSAGGDAGKQGLRSRRQDIEPDADELARSFVLIEMPPAMRAAVADFLRDRQLGVWKRVAGTTHALLRSTLAEGLRAGDTTTDLQNRVAAILGNYSKTESRRVARTEATGSMNFGEQQARNEAKIDWKEWVATIDMRTRGADPKRRSKYDHYNAHGQKVTNAGAFIVSGQKLRYPGDSSQGASAGNIVNCRCCSVAAFEPPK